MAKQKRRSGWRPGGAAVGTICMIDPEHRAAAITCATGMRDGRPLRMAKRIILENGQTIDVEPAPQAARFRFREVEAPGLFPLMRATEDGEAWFSNLPRIRAA